MKITVGDIARLMRGEDWIGVKNSKTGCEDYAARAADVSAEWSGRIVNSIEAIYIDGKRGVAGLLFGVEGV